MTAAGASTNSVKIVAVPDGAATPAPTPGISEQDLNQALSQGTSVPNAQQSASDTVAGALSSDDASKAEPTLKPVPPDTPPYVDRGKRLHADPAGSFMKRLAWEAISTSQDWRLRWIAPDFGRLGVRIVHKKSLTMARGVVMPWRRDQQGFPEVVLHVVVEMPVLKRVALTDLQRPVESVPLDIRQYVSFYPQKGRWWAAASPYYVTLGKRGDSVELLSIREGKGAWSAWVGSGGLVVKDFIEGGLAAARSKIVRTFRDEEINWFLRGNSDVIFYLRPRMNQPFPRQTPTAQAAATPSTPSHPTL